MDGHNLTSNEHQKYKQFSNKTTKSTNRLSEKENYQKLSQKFILKAQVSDKVVTFGEERCNKPI